MTGAGRAFLRSRSRFLELETSIAAQRSGRCCSVFGDGVGLRSWFGDVIHAAASREDVAFGPQVSRLRVLNEKGHQQVERAGSRFIHEVREFVRR